MQGRKVQGRKDLPWLVPSYYSISLLWTQCMLKAHVLWTGRMTTPDSSTGCFHGFSGGPCWDIESSSCELGSTCLRYFPQTLRIQWEYRRIHLSHRAVLLGRTGNDSRGEGMSPGTRPAGWQAECGLDFRPPTGRVPLRTTQFALALQWPCP